MRIATLLAASLVVTVSCSEGSTVRQVYTPDGPMPVPPQSVATVVVSPSTATLVPGAKTHLAAIAKDGSGSVVSGVHVVWTSSDTLTVAVSDSGDVRALRVGSASVVATADNLTASSSILVNAVPVGSVSVSLAASSIQIGSTTQATAVVKDSTGAVVTDRAISWSSSAPAVATVSSSGLVTAVSTGSAAISATCEGKVGVSNLAIVSAPAPVATVAVTLAAGTLSVGVSTQATAVLKDASGNVLTGRAITWSSSNTAVATVNSSGLVTAVSAGSANIAAASEGITGQAQLTVSAVPVASVTVTLNSPSLTVGQNTQASAVTKDANGNVLTGRAITWSSSNTAVATVNSSGLVTAVSAGSANIAAASEGITGQAQLTVSAVPVASVTVTLNSPSLTVGQNTQASAVTKDANGNVLTGRPITWASSNTTVATVNASGLVTALTAGTASISATSGSITGAASLTVTTPPPPPPPAADEPMFQTGTDVSLFTEGFESYSSLTALLTYNSTLSRYTYYGQQYLSFPSPGGGHTGANAFRNTYPVQSAYLDVGGFINAERVPGAPTTRPQFTVIEFWLRTSPGYPWRRQGASDQQGAGEKTLVWNASTTSTEPRFVLEPGLAPCCKGQWWGGKYDAAFPNGVGIVMALDGSSVSGGAMWYFQNLNAATRNPVGYMNDGTWHLWKIKLTPSTVQTGSSGDGAIEMWVDGVKVLEYIGTDPTRPEYNKVLVPTTVAAAFSSFGMGGPFNGGPSPAQGPQWKDYDDVRIWYRP